MAELNKIKTWQKVFLALCAVAFTVGLLLLLAQGLRELVLAFGEWLVEKNLNHEIWNRIILNAGISAMILSCMGAALALFPEKIKQPLENMYDKIFSQDFSGEKEKLALRISLAVFLLLGIASVVFHETWRDEGQAWLIAKNVSPFGLFDILGSEGHPALWFLFLMPFAKLGFPFEWLGFLSLSVVFSAALIFVRFYKIPVAVKIIALFSPVFFYFSPVIARSYCFLTLELVCLGAFYNRRKEKPVAWGILLAAMLQTHIYLAALSGGLLLQMLFEFFKETDRKTARRIFLGGIIGGLSAVLLLLELSGEAANRDSFFAKLGNNPSVAIVTAISALLRSVSFNFSGIGAALGYVSALVFLLAFVFLLVENSRALADSWQAFVIFALTTLFLFFVFCVYPGGHWNHCVAIFSILLVFLFIFPRTTKSLSLVFCTLLFVSCATSVSFCVRDFFFPFSNSKAMARYIKNNFDAENTVFVLERKVMATSILPYLDGEFEFVVPDGTRYKFSSDRLRTDDSAWNAEKTFQKNTVYLFGEKLSGEDGMELVHAEDAKSIVKNEIFYLYKKTGGVQ